MEEKKTEEERQVYRAPVAPDHSCLFTSFAELCLYSKHGDSTFDDAAKLRNVCAEGVLANQEVYCEPILGKSPQDYATWIKNELNWGGEIEIRILAEHFNVECSVVEMLKCEGNPGGNWLVYNRGDKEGSRKGRIYLLYTGQHYDPIRRKPENGAAVSSVFPIPECKSKFDAAATKVGLQALAAWKIKQRQRTRKAFKCHGCGQVCDSTGDFQTHCMEVEHDDEFAYTCDELTIVEDVDDVEMRRKEQGVKHIDDYHSFYPTNQTPLANQYPLTLLLPDFDKMDDAQAPRKEYFSVEHYWQSQQFVGTNDEFAESLRTHPIVEEMKSSADSGSKPRPDWDDVKEEVLLFALREKFSKSEEMAKVLKATEPKPIVLLDQAANPWLGANANAGFLKGRNVMGKLLETVRATL